jgi:hypothetical protein
MGGTRPSMEDEERRPVSASVEAAPIDAAARRLGETFGRSKSAPFSKRRTGKAKGKSAADRRSHREGGAARPKSGFTHEISFWVQARITARLEASTSVAEPNGLTGKETATCGSSPRRFDVIISGSQLHPCESCR